MRHRAEDKRKAVALRMAGESYPSIEKTLGINKSTLSGWLKGIPLPTTAVEIILDRKRRAITSSRIKAVASNKKRNVDARRGAEDDAAAIVETLPRSRAEQAIVLATLYAGEGFKRRSQIGLGNSNEKILVLFVRLLQSVFAIDKHGLKCVLHLRDDQDATAERAHWSSALGISESQFGKPQFDKRTLGKKTRIGYHGVCSVYYYDARIEKQLTALQYALLNDYLPGG